MPRCRNTSNSRNTRKSGFVNLLSFPRSLHACDLFWGKRRGRVSSLENLVIANLPALLRCLGIEGSSVRSAAPYFWRRTNRHEACQIDLLIQAKHRLYVCEVRCRSRIDQGIIEEVSRKLQALLVPRGISVRPALVYEGELDPGIQADGYFDALVSFRDLLSARC